MSDEEYCRLVRLPQYLTLTQPDITFSVSKIAQFMELPKLSHWNANCWIFKYLSRTQDYEICLTRLSDHQLVSFCDADWAGDQVGRCSQTRYLIYLGGSLISWASKKQNTISHSSTESEYRRVATMVHELERIKSLISELGIDVCLPITVYCDNLAVTCLTSNPIYHAKTKHVAINLHFVRERVEDDTLKVQHISGSEQLADILTKSLRPKPLPD